MRGEKRQTGVVRRMAAVGMLCLFVIFMGTGAGAAAPKKGLVKVGKSWYYYQNGKPLKNKWKTIRKGKTSSRYYFGGDGRAVCGSSAGVKTKKIKGAVYAFDRKGRMVKGVVLVKEKLCYFSAGGKKNKAITGQLQAAAGYEKDVRALKELLASLGCPLRKEVYYGVGCRDAGEDGSLYYKGFEISVFRLDSGETIIIDIVPSA